MLTRLYVDNYKALVNFELHLKGLTLLTGRNGTGKTSVLEVLQILRSFASDGQAISDLLTADTLTRWETRGLQTLELDLEVDGHSLTYKVTVEHKVATSRPEYGMSVSCITESRSLKPASAMITCTTLSSTAMTTPGALRCWLTGLAQVWHRCRSAPKTRS